MKSCLTCVNKERVGYPQNKNLFRCRAFNEVLTDHTEEWDCPSFEKLPHIETINGKTMEEYQIFKRTQIKLL